MYLNLTDSSPYLPYCNSGAVGIGIFWFVIHHYFPIRHVPPPVGGDRCFLDEEHSVGPFHQAWNYLRQSSDFFCIGVAVLGAVFGVLHNFYVLN